MPKRILNARTALGAGLGGVTGLAVNRLVLGNKSLLSNLIATGLGGIGGGALGYYLNSLAEDSLSPVEKKKIETLSGESKSSGTDGAKGKATPDQQKDVAYHGYRLGDPEATDQELRESRDILRAAGYSDAKIEQIANSSREHRGLNDTNLPRRIAYIGGGAGVGEILHQLWAPKGKDVAKAATTSADPKSVVLRSQSLNGKHATLTISPTGQVLVGIPGTKVTKKGRTKTFLRTDQPLTPSINLGRPARREVARILAAEKGYTNLGKLLMGTDDQKATARFIYRNAPMTALSKGAARLAKSLAKGGLRLGFPAVGGLIGNWLEQDARNYDPVWVERFKKLGLGK
jgi:hypothetical protein